MVIVPGLATHIDHAVDRRAAAKDAAPGVAKRSPVETGFGFGGESPIGARVSHAKEITDRDVNPEIAALAAGFQKRDLGSRVLRQPVGQDAPGTAGADNHVIEFAEAFHRPPLPPLWPVAGRRRCV